MGAETVGAGHAREHCGSAAMPTRKAGLRTHGVLPHKESTCHR